MSEYQQHEINARISTLMRCQRISQADLSKTLGISQQAVSRRLTCVSDWRLREIHTVAEELGVTSARLIDVTTPTPVIDGRHRR